MEGEEGNTRNTKEALSTEAGHIKGDQDRRYALPSAHTIGHDSWQQVGVMLVTAFNCGYILSFSNLMLVPLGWTWGIICLLVFGLYSAYAIRLLAAFHFIDGQRFIRYRDLMGFLFGREMFYTTWVFQFLTLLLGNMGFILLGGRALKEINSEFSDSPFRLQYFIAITGVTYFVFAFFIPTLSAMRSWLGPSTVITFAYIVILLVVVVKDGKANTKRDYAIHGNEADRVLNAFGAIAAIIVCNSSGLLLEIQSTLRAPAVTNMRKALNLQFTVGLVFYYGVSIVGYWAYGSTVSEYLPQELSGPKSVKVLINAAVFLQSIVSQHMFVAPIHEFLDTKFLKLDKSMNSKGNLKRRLYVRALLFAVNTFVTAAFPFMGDFVNLFGSFTLVPLTFVFPSMIFIKVKGKAASLEKILWHWFNIVIFSLLAVVTTISAVRLIVNNVKEYSFFANT
ncbi:proline transporter 2-like [Pyrus ussuriensis x Pyrus communis]|uniref:Proline transporter 2-like n=1 Tax=Pyrus ussuriensis x Pyrus communis TaxID=2448454 RepID=A0A5N5I077_9ROSA|nr:proline transporter 2-like [Pyrus ussuriensis x Pyrus communis]